MSARAPQPPRQRSAAPSERVQIARLALDAALAVDGVASSHAGPKGMRVTEDRGERLTGVLATALSGGRYGIDLHLVAGVVPLPQLAERVRSRAVRAVSAAGLAHLLGPVNITIEDVVLPNEVSER